MAYEDRVNDFRNEILAGGVLDLEGVHHEFVSGAHGQKLDFDIIPTYADRHEERFSPLYGDWISVTAEFIGREFPSLPEVVLGVADGTNRVARDVAVLLSEGSDKQIHGFATEKDSENKKILWLPKQVEKQIVKLAPELVVVVEDVGTTGSQSVQIAEQALGAGAGHVVVVPTWQRQENLARLDEVNIEYRAIIAEPLPTYSPEDCVATGFCSMDWQFILRDK